MLENVSRSFNLEASTHTLEREALIQLLAQRIAEMLTYETDLLFSTLYRLDVLEYKINEVIRGSAQDKDIASGLARLVIERQEEKNITKAAYKSKQEEGL